MTDASGRRPPKIDLKKDLDHYRARRGEFRTVDVPRASYLMIDGHGDPNTAPAYRDAVATLFPVAYAIKFAVRRETGRDYVVMPLEALWWADDMTAFTTARDKSSWSWTAMIRVPDETSEAILQTALHAAEDARAIGLLRRAELDEGRCVQTLHVGSYDDEAPVLARLHAEVISELGLRMTGRHHEIYLSDARKTAPDRLRTILRQPVEPVDALDAEVSD